MDKESMIFEITHLFCIIFVPASLTHFSNRHLLLFALSNENLVSFSGIFDDPAIVAEIKQAVATIKKACVQFTELHASANGPSPVEMNQMIRWVNTKEEHAKKIITIVSEYCLCQRVKKEVFESDKDYVEALKAHHAVMSCAMKAKQNVDDATITNLESAVDQFAKMYIKD